MKLYMDFDRDLTEFEAEGKLRGTGARLIVQLEYGGNAGPSPYARREVPPQKLESPAAVPSPIALRFHSA
jgi:hypothetical protein